MVKVPSDASNDDRIQIVITVVRQPTGAFSIWYENRQGFGPFKGRLSTIQSPTRLVWYIREIGWAPVEEMLLRLVEERWGDELERVVVSPVELLQPPEPAREWPKQPSS